MSNRVRKRRKALKEAIPVLLKRIQGELLKQFPEMTALEVAKAIKAAAEQFAGQLMLETQQANAASAKEMRRKIIEIGYRTLATEFHPDSGGSIEAMQRLNRVRDRLDRKLPLDLLRRWGLDTP